MKLYLDDVRNPSDTYTDSDWVVVRTAEEAIEILETNVVTEISFDHDLGTELSGYDVATKMEELVITGVIQMPVCRIHSANPPGRDRILLAVRNMETYASLVKQHV